MKQTFFSFILLFPILFSCDSEQLGRQEDPADQIEANRVNYQARMTYQYDSVFFDNKFLGARLNDVRKDSVGSYTITIEPENTPINHSAWYAFRVWSNQKKNIQINIRYTTSRHRYHPKWSKDLKTWTKIDTSNFHYIDSVKKWALNLEVNTDTTYIAAQELVTSKEVMEWVDSISTKSYIRTDTIGLSTNGRPLVAMDISETEEPNTILVLCRQHPPEVPGQFAMESFIETIVGNSTLAAQFRSKFKILVLPLINPDGVDNGHWRHNAKGVDLNRDWRYVQQGEIITITNFIKNWVNDKKLRVWFGLDFHATRKDKIYTISDKVIPREGSIVQPWLDQLRLRLSDDWEEEPFGVREPISKNWIYKEFGAEGVTYEVGDKTDRTYLRLKARLAAEELMRELLKRVE